MNEIIDKNIALEQAPKKRVLTILIILNLISLSMPIAEFNFGINYIFNSIKSKIKINFSLKLFSGTKNLNNCSFRPLIPIWLVIGAFVLLINSMITILSSLRSLK
jgi:hypothetical protein